MYKVIRKGWVLMGVLALSACSMSSDPATPPEKIQEHVDWLAAEERNGRLAGSADEAAAANYIADHFESVGVRPAGDQGTYFQHFELEGPMAQAMESDQYLSRNVVGMVEGTDSPSHYIIVGAHYDGQGPGGIISMNHDEEELLHNSADDNASGTAAVMHLAEVFADNPAGKTLIFAAFSGEELGLLGSGYFTENLQIDADSILAMINFDMVGRLSDGELNIYGSGSSPAWEELIEGVEEGDLVIEHSSAGTGASDHASFHRIEVPAIHYFTGIHEDYHRETDTADRIDAEGIVSVAGHAEKLIRSLAERSPADIGFAGGTAPSKPGIDKGGVTLGVFPDYSFSGRGFRIENVRSDGPAGRAGIEPGDIILQLGEIPVLDIHSYMEALGHFSAGDETVVKIRRSDEIIEIQLTF